MKIAAVSDTHCRTDAAIKAVKKHSPDILLHLGDMTDDAEEIMNIFPKLEVINVKGNCDYAGIYPIYREFEKCGVKFFITHGHTYNVKYGYDRIYYASLERKADICFFGHSHVSYIGKGSVLLVNPGSISFPRNTALGTYAITDIDNKEIKVKIYGVDGSIYAEENFKRGYSYDKASF